jgi:hypothetical protein
MLIAPVITRLRDLAPGFANRVAGAADLAPALEQESLAVPCAFVVPLEDDAGENTTTDGTTQEVDETIAVIVCVSNVADERGQAALDALEAAKVEILAALLNWPPAEGHGGFEYRGGFIIDMNRARTWWRYDFAAINVVCSTP